ncbi:TonB-dependent receptor [Sphingopyxis panaciterrulae]|uniref:Iron complex outermembrane receptor protein n=1 Tax=Sphingopyxis panaciterrulae TaxID=462372 RepID=A0A7W9B6D7_9SPHN|nr:TonB-dependent receptor [Sphingopyxis panaciterrulae]MBB5707057.1 iron complex outermembrane receptor protein [Sphingopyxis panaciterrulae]
MSVPLLLAAPAHAQDPSNQSSASSSRAQEDIVVTARNKEESILQAPLAVSSFSGETLTERNINNQDDLSLQTPGFDFSSPGGVSTARPVIRGMSQSSRAGEETNVATFIDGVYIDGFSSSTIFMEGIQRVEILRGPQSAQYGRNSFAGAINYITKKPTMDFETGGSAVLGDGERRGITGFVNGALLPGQVAMRVDAGYDNSGGYYKDAVSGQRLSARETWFARAGLLAQMSDRVKAVLQLSYEDSHVNTFARNAVATDDPNLCCRTVSRGAPSGYGTLYRGELHTDPNEDFTYDPRAFAGDSEAVHGNLTVTAEWDNLMLTSISGYDHRTFDTLADQDRSPDGTIFLLTPRAPGSSPRRLLMQTLSGTKEKRDAISQELRLQSTGNSFLNWAIGGYYSRLNVDSTRRQGGEIITNTPLGPNPVANTIAVIEDGVIPIAEITSARAEFLSAFASVDLNLTDQFIVSAEGRYTWEDKQIDNSFLSAAPGGVGSGLEKANFKYFTPRVILQYRPSDDLSLYLSAAKGTKSGGINAGVSVLATPANPNILPEWATYKPEKAWSYEAGLKFNLLDRRLTGSIAAYYVDWTNQQVSNTLFVASVSRTVTAIANAAKSRVKGIEFEGSAVLTDGFILNVGYSLNDAKYRDAVFSAYNVENADIYGFPGGDASGKRIQNTSKHSFNGGAQFTAPAFAGFDATLRMDYIYRSKQYDTPVNLAWVPSYSTVNLNFSLEKEGVRLGAFCNNMLNDRDASVGFNSRNINGEVVYQIQPREGRRCGVRANFSFR